MAVLGTLLGSVVTHFFQGRASIRTAELARAEQLRQERIAAYSTFAGELHDYRRAQNDRWYRAHEESPPGAADAARYASYEARIAARAALTRVQLVCADPALRELAARAFEFTNCMHDAEDTAERDRRSREAKDALEAFVARAAPTVHQ